MTRGTIPGTNGLPDNPLHRASLWLEDLKGTRGGIERRAPLVEMSDDFDRLAREVGLDMTGQELLETASFYGESFAKRLPGAVSIMTTVGPIDLHSFILSVWIDGLQHGAAAVAGLHGDAAPEDIAQEEANPARSIDKIHPDYLQAATDQGLLPFIEECERQQLPVAIWQTGGWTMVAAVNSQTREGQFYTVTSDGEGDSFMVARQNDYSWDEGADVLWERIEIPAAEVVRAIREQEAEA